MKVVIMPKGSAAKLKASTVIYLIYLKLLSNLEL